MIDQLRELSAAEPFRRFKIHMRAGHSFHISCTEDIAFTAFGAPQVREVRTPPRNPISATPRDLKPGKWHILNVDAIDEIVLL